MNSTLNPPEMADATETVRLPDNGTTVSAEELRVQLVLALDTHDAVTVDAGEVESIGQAVLQLLVAARAEAQAAEKPFTIINPTPAFVERVTRCRLADAVGFEIEGADA
ncbi:STAS domain-containing protein [Sphingomonadaceae bacterium LXI357]|uniref:STAS domain-containing protein n=2 Tax=Stakelama marina TaxID=2826939 RepID=A0A8T4IDA5_9SPHN|nr:STAS domain-containing protein [Stakelama marina]